MANYPASQPGSKRHTLSVLVENRPGVLARIAGLFARRAFNINSLSVSPTERPDISRVTVTAEAETTAACDAAVAGVAARASGTHERGAGPSVPGREDV